MDGQFCELDTPSENGCHIADSLRLPVVGIPGHDETKSSPTTAVNDLSFTKLASGYKSLLWKQPIKLKYNNAVLPEITVAYETWGNLNTERDNAILIYAGLSLSSHVKSNEDNPSPGWWERFVGPGLCIDTNKFFVICTNHIGGCYGTSGPASINPSTKQRYAASFPIISVEDIVRVSFLVVDHLGIDKLYASIGGSLGGMCSLMSAALFPDRICRLISICAAAYSHPSSIAVWSVQRRCIMSDPNWRQGRYYDNTWPTTGMKLARESAWHLFRCGPEWDERFGRMRIDDKKPIDLSATFTVEKYIEHQGEKFNTTYDPNTLLYLSKALDLFDMSGKGAMTDESLSKVRCPVLVIGVLSDIFYPITLQRELVHLLRQAGNSSVKMCEVNSQFGHDSFLLDLQGIGTPIEAFLDERHEHEVA